jgi:hypothetical protein
MKRWIYFLFLAIFLVFLTDFCQRQTKGFRLCKISAAEEKEEASNTADQDITSLLNTSFHYLKKGKASYVFLSEDGKYVLKFLKTSYTTPPFWTRSKVSHFFFPSLAEAKKLEIQRLKESKFASYQTAFSQLQRQTKGIYLHLYKTGDLKQKIVLYDPIGIKHTIDADETLFILQERVQPFSPYFKKLLESNEQEKAKELLLQFVEFIQERAIKGISDKDLSPQYNLGILEGSLVTLDLDSLQPAPSALSLLERMRCDAKKLHRWVQSKDLGLALFLEEKILETATKKEYE